MSLINEALKKAQRLRSNEPVEEVPLPGATVRVAKREQPRSARSLVLLVGGSVALVVISVIVTVYLINRNPAPTSGVAKPAAGKPTDTKPSSPVIDAPLIKVPLAPTTTEPAPAKTEPATVASPAKPETPTVPVEKPPVVAATPANTEPTVTTPPETKPAPPAKTPPEKGPAKTAGVAPTPAATTTPAAQPAGPARQDERIHAYVDALRVSGIRSSGGESRVLMNDRVFRVNDIVDRGLALRLTAVAPDSLTFTDANGATYVKNF